MFSVLIRLFVRDFKSVHLPYVQLAYIRVVSWAGIIVNIALGFLKVVFGILYGSIALTSDGVDSFSNVLSSLILILSYKVTTSPESLDRPFGGGRAIYIAHFSIALFLGFTGFQIIFLSLEHLTFLQAPPQFGNAILWIILFSFLANEWQARFCFYISKKIQSDILHTEGIHRRSDNFFSLAVLIAWGASFFKLYWVDGVVGIFFGGIILKTAYDTAKKNIRELLGTSPPPEFIADIVQLGRQIKGVIGIHEIVVHRYGAKTLASMHVEMDETMSLRESHLICDQLEDLLQSQFNIYVITHSDPSNVTNPSTAIISQNKSQLLQDPYISSFVNDIGHIYVGQDRSTPEKLFVSLDLFLKRPIGPKEEENLYLIFYPKIQNLLMKDIHLKLRPRPLFGTNIY